jgi:hypothetical protein
MLRKVYGDAFTPAGQQEQWAQTLIEHKRVTIPMERRQGATMVALAFFRHIRQQAGHLHVRYFKTYRSQEGESVLLSSVLDMRGPHEVEFERRGVDIQTYIDEVDVCIVERESVQERMIEIHGKDVGRYLRDVEYAVIIPLLVRKVLPTDMVRMLHSFLK